MNKLIGMSFFLLFQTNIMAGELYVEQSAQGTSCIITNPCGSIQQAVEVASEGDTIFIAAGVYKENVFIQTANITLRGEFKLNTIIEAGGGREGATGNAGNPLDAVIEVRAANVSIFELSLIHPVGKAVKREAAIFAWMGSQGLHVKDCIIERKRNKRIDEPTTPGSRGIFIFRGPGCLIENNEFRGNYQDHVHLPSNKVIVRDNIMIGASRAGISVMDPVSFVGPNVFDSTLNVIQDNVIMDSLDDGIHIQGDITTITDNALINNKGYGIYLCGEGLGGGCYFPGEEAVSEENFVADNIFQKNKQGTIGDFGVGNIIK